MKKLLIIQTDDAYFLFETLQVLEKNHAFLKNFELTVLVNESPLNQIHDKTVPLMKGLTTNATAVLNTSFDISVNLSLNEESWSFHEKVNSQDKIGVFSKNGQLIVNDLWSSYLLTLKSKAPFLTFHLQDVYKNILGIRGRNIEIITSLQVKEIVVGTTAPHLFPVDEQEEFVARLADRFPRIPLKDISEIDLLEDLSDVIYIGPAGLESLKLCEAGAKGIFLTSAFQGFNLLPYGSRHQVVSTRGGQFSSTTLFSLVESEILQSGNRSCPYSLYRTDYENIFGAYLLSENQSDDNYPFYQSHVVLWNFLLNLFDTNLEITNCSRSQIEILKSHQGVLTKFIRLHDYAMISADTIYLEAKSKNSDAGKIQGHIKNLLEIEKISDQIAASHAFLRPVLDFYRIRRGQNNGSTLQEQSQANLLTYSEEHQALQALNELFSVTLKKNEVSI